MKLKGIATVGLIAALSVMPPEPVQADGGDAIAGALIGGIIGSAIANDQNRKRQQTTTTTTRRHSPAKSTRSTVSSAQREANREVQTALNYFGYPVGTPDGSIGPKSRAAISQYQTMLGYPATGQLTEYERTILTVGYNRAIAGGPATAQIIASHPQGIRGLLLNQRDEMAGLPAAAPLAPAPAAPALPTVATSLPVLAAAAPSTETPLVPATALPSFLGQEATNVSLASQCNKIGLMTNTNGGYTKAAMMTDAPFALSEQFCLARTYAMSQGEDLAAQVAGFTMAQISEQCRAFGPVLKDHVAALSMKPQDEVLRGVSGFVLGSGMAPAQLSRTAKICLGVGYTRDEMDVAIGSALLLTALGEKGYAELLGHHLSQGFGATVRPDLALGWYQMGIGATSAGGTVFAPGMPDRTEVIRRAAFTIVGQADTLEPLTEASLPAFPLSTTSTTVAAPAPKTVSP